MASIDPVSDLAAAAFGIRYLYPYQRLVVANVLDAIDAPDDGGEPERQVVILPTGAGKSLCFQLPAALCPGPTLIVYPLLGLMADQERRLASTGIGAVVLKGGMTAEERETAFMAIRSKSARIVITNPEMLAVPLVLEFLKSAGIFHFVIDEAHCISEWGDGFRPAYLGLGEAVLAIGPRVVTAFTATASPPILSRVADVLFGSSPYRLVAGAPDRPNIRYEVRPALSMTRALREAVSTMPRPAIVFAASRPGVEMLAEELRASLPAIDSRFYHAGLEKAERSGIEAWFMASEGGVLCATCAYGMGMDKPNIRTVIHYGAPSSVEAYLQESGRAGRDGEQSYAVLLRKAELGDYERLDAEAPSGEPLQAGADPVSALRRERSAMMKRYATGDYGCRRSYLLQALGSPDAETLACRSCDRCDRDAIEAAKGSEAILSIAKRHSRRFTLFNAAAFAIGKASAEKAPLNGSLDGWREDEAREAFECAVSIGIVRRLSLGPWKGLLVHRGRSQSGRTSSSMPSSAATGAAGAFFGCLRALGNLGAARSRQGSATYRASSHKAMKAPSVASTSQRDITANASVSLSMIENSLPIPASGHSSSDDSSHAY